MKVIILGVFFGILGIVGVSGAEDASICRKNDDHSSKAISKVHELSTQCSEAVIKEYFSRKEYETNVLNNYLKKVNVDLKKYAVSVNALIVNCGVELTHKLENVLRCDQLSKRRVAIKSRMVRLEKWENNFKRELSSSPLAALKNVGGPPCVSYMEYPDLKDMENFDKELFSFWNKCMNEL